MKIHCSRYCLFFFWGLLGFFASCQEEPQELEAVTWWETDQRPFDSSRPCGETENDSTCLNAFFFSQWQKVKSYPTKASDLGIEGNVTIGFVMDAKGSISQAKVLNSNGSIALGDSLLNRIARDVEAHSVAIVESFGSVSNPRILNKKAVPVKFRCAIPYVLL